MYVDAKPVSTYAETQGWKMPTPSHSPQPSGSLKRPPLLSQPSSSSSLSGTEQAIPSFKSFARRTPSLADQYKPLLPIPLIPRRASSTSPPKSRSTSLYSQRRSSSIYSRTVSQWFDDDSSWSSADLRDDIRDMPPLPILQPVAYSKSTPQLIERPAARSPPAMLEPRAYSPLITTPSSTASRVTTPNQSPMPSPGPSPQQQQQVQQPLSPVMYPTSPPLHDLSEKPVQTVSLEQAKAAVHSPGAVHLLPEELRAQAQGKAKSPQPTIAKSRSHEPIRVPTLGFFHTNIHSAGPPPALPSPPTLIDTQGEHRSFQGQGRLVDTASESSFPAIQHAPPLPLPSIVHPEMTPGPKNAAPLENQPRQESKVKAAESLGLVEEESRGRTKQRGPRSINYGHYLPNGRRVQRSPSPLDEERKDAQKVASEYHNMLSEQYRQPSSSPAYNSDDSIKAHMKLVPQPLFKNKPAAKLPGSVSGRGSDRGNNASDSPLHLRADSVTSRASSASHGSLPMQLPLTPDSMHSRSSTTGSIPISPPTNLEPTASIPFGRPLPSVDAPSKPKSRSRSRDDRVSMYYPYVGPRKGKKAKDKKAAEEAKRPVPPMPLPPADISAHRLRTPESSTASSSLRSTRSGGFPRRPSSNNESYAGSDRQKAPLLQRLADKASIYADLISKPSSMTGASGQNSRPSDSTTASAHSPHLLPSPVRNDPPPVHLGWSVTAKSNFDNRHSGSAPRTPQSTHFTNLPTRPRDETAVGLREGDALGGRGRKGSIFGGFGLLDSWKEKKKEEKREELKKMIRVVPQGPPRRMRTLDLVPANSESGSAGPRRSSMDRGAPTPNARPAPGPGGLGRRMSALGWM